MHLKSYRSSSLEQRPVFGRITKSSAGPLDSTAIVKAGVKTLIDSNLAIGGRRDKNNLRSSDCELWISLIQVQIGVDLRAAVSHATYELVLFFKAFLPIRGIQYILSRLKMDSSTVTLFTLYHRDESGWLKQKNQE
ncbi:unnamed protein product (mitochondrion) [Musa textilis]